MSTISPIVEMAMELRVQALEALLDGPSSVSEQNQKDRKNKDQGGLDIGRRVAELEDKLRNIVREQKADPVARLVDNYDGILNLLFPGRSSNIPFSDPKFTSRRESETKEYNGVDSSSLVPLDTKLSLILPSTEDILQADKEGRELQILLDRGVDGAGDLSAYQPLLKRLETLKSQHRENQISFRHRVEGMTQVLTRWDEMVKSSSKVFLNLHQTLIDIERAIERAERAMRAEASDTEREPGANQVQGYVLEG